MIERMTTALGLQPGDVNVIATGGLAPLVVAECRTVTDSEPWLTLLGLGLVFDRNT
jgi:type III pantothenate kinase